MDTKTIGSNVRALKVCNKIYDLTGIYILVVYIASSAASFIVAALTKDSTSLIIDGVLFKLFTGAAAYLGCYRKINIYSAAGAILALVNFLIFQTESNLILCILMVAVFVILFFTNRKYEYLEAQEGFPYFVERFEDQKNMREHPVDYQEYVDELKKTSSNTMDEI